VSLERRPVARDPSGMADALRDRPDDDEPVGHVLTRREILTFLGATGVLWLARCSSAGPGSQAEGAAAGGGREAADGRIVSGCVARPEMTAGPYFVDGALERSDIRSEPSTGEPAPGTPLDIAFRVSRIADGACVPLAGAIVDVWQCDALGVYSDVADPTFDTRGRKFLRGWQATDADGVARFTTVYPGWYPGRAVHVHFKVRSAPEVDPGFDFTSQLFFDDALTDRVHAGEPYAGRAGRRRNEEDGIFRRGGTELVLAVEPAGEGYGGTFEIGLQGV
jgi:protocatechuate 3,4-dioxygenase beta subunit